MKASTPPLESKLLLRSLHETSRPIHRDIGPVYHSFPSRRPIHISTSHAHVCRQSAHCQHILFHVLHSSRPQHVPTTRTMSPKKSLRSTTSRHTKPSQHCHDSYAMKRRCSSARPPNVQPVMPISCCCHVSRRRRTRRDSWHKRTGRDRSQMPSYPHRHHPRSSTTLTNLWVTFSPSASSLCWKRVGHFSYTVFTHRLRPNHFFPSTDNVPSWYAPRTVWESLGCTQHICRLCEWCERVSSSTARARTTDTYSLRRSRFSSVVCVSF